MNPTLKQACLIFNGVKGLGPVTSRKILQNFNNDPLEALRAFSSKEYPFIDGVNKSALAGLANWSQYFDVQKEDELLKKNKADYVLSTDDDYPPYLREIYDPPLGLYCLGAYRPQHATVAIVGSRRCTLYGKSVAKRIAGDLAKRGFCVVSGMARGIDTAAHEGALEAGGKSAAVLGCGLDIIYPRENEKLYHKIVEFGVVISEFPFGRHGDKHTFPQRNRIVSGMSQAVVVIETDNKGGSMITARLAGEQGRHVFAVPGRIDQTTSAGCHQLIRDGATLLSSVDDILEELSYLDQMVSRLDEKRETEKPRDNSFELSGLSEDERSVLQLLSEGALMPIDDIAECTQLTVADVSSALLMLELKQCVAKRTDGTFEVVPQY